MHNILFICKGNSARSIMAEAIMNSLGSYHFTAYSAGSRPSGYIKDQALRCLKQNKLATEGLHSKSWSEFAVNESLKIDFVITVCNKAADEICPIWPNKPITIHWEIAGPSRVGSTSGDLDKSFQEAFMKLHHKISVLLTLPLDGLDHQALYTELQKISYL